MKNKKADVEMARKYCDQFLKTCGQIFHPLRSAAFLAGLKAGRDESQFIFGNSVNIQPLPPSHEDYTVEKFKQEIELLRSKQSQHESTLIETMRVRDEALAKLEIAREALEWCGQPYEPDVEFTAPDTQIDLVERQRAAREALEKMGE